jgi:hypothetical protein
MSTIFKNSRLNLCFLLIIGLFSSCLKDNDTFEEYPSNPWLNLQKTEIDVSGEIIDEQGKPVKDVLITSNDKTTLTDKNGVFVIKKSLQNADFIYIKAEKKGYFNGTRVIRGTNGKQNLVKIMLLEQKNIATLKSSEGGEVTVDGVKIKFPINGYIDAAGKTFNGNIKVAAKYLDPTKIETFLKMPGDLRAANFQGQEQFLETFGMVAVELTDEKGNKLNLGNGGEAELSFENKNAKTHEKIPLWHFDEKIGAWREEGQTTLINNRYVGKVSHFSFWNCDFPYDKVYAQGRIVHQNGSPASNVWVGLNLVGQPWGGHGYTDDNGYFKGCIPKGEDLELTVNSWDIGCLNTVVYKKTLGSFNNDVDFGTIVVTVNNNITTKTFNGKAVDCNGNNLVNGYISVKLKPENRQINLFTDSDGKFNYTIKVNPCSKIDNTDLDVTAYDLTNKKESLTKSFTLNPTNTDVGTIEVCSTVTEFVDLTFGTANSFYILGHPQQVSIEYRDSTSTKYLHIYIAEDSNIQVKGVSFAVQVSSNPPVTGTYTVLYSYGWGVLPGNTILPTSQSLSINLTEVSLVKGEFTAGTISGTMLLDTGQTITVSGSFRVKKP